MYLASACMLAFAVNSVADLSFNSTIHGDCDWHLMRLLHTDSVACADSMRSMQNMAWLMLVMRNYPCRHGMHFCIMQICSPSALQAHFKYAFKSSKGTCSTCCIATQTCVWSNYNIGQLIPQAAACRWVRRVTHQH